MQSYGFGKGFGIGIGSQFKTPSQKRNRPIYNKKPSGPRRAGPGYTIGRGQARGTPK